jgi:hypothetical protein
MGDTPALRFLRLDDGEFDSAPGQAINSRYLSDEKAVVSELLALVRLPMPPGSDPPRCDRARGRRAQPA